MRAAPALLVLLALLPGCEGGSSSSAPPDAHLPAVDAGLRDAEPPPADARLGDAELPAADARPRDAEPPPADASPPDAEPPAPDASPPDAELPPADASPPDADAAVVDDCPDDPAKTEPGICGCGVADTDTDGDGSADCVDLCPDDPAKTEPLECGCGARDLPSCDEIDPPQPDPAAWASPPSATGTTSVSMTAVPAADDSGVEYFFECVASGCHDSGWQEAPEYEDVDLAPDHAYAYRVKVRDRSLNQNETAWSPEASVTTDADPGTRAGLEAAYFDLDEPLVAHPDLAGRAPDVARIEGTLNHAATAEPWDGLGFADTFASRHTGLLRVEVAGQYTLYLAADDQATLWLRGEPLAVVVGGGEAAVAIELAAGYHPFRLDAFENDGDAQLVLSWAGPGIPRQVVPTTALYRADPPDVDPPEPSPLVWAQPPAPAGIDAIAMVVAAAADPSGVHYYFECVAGECHDSGWQHAPRYVDTGLPPGMTATYRVRARDLSAAEARTGWSPEASATTDARVPDVAGLPQAAAEAALGEAVLVAGEITTEHSEVVPQGHVIRHTPAAGAQRAAGSAVDLVVSLGRPIPVPDVVGVPHGDAEAALQGVELALGELTYVESCAVPAGAVVEQAPPAGAVAWPGAPVDLVVSTGPNAAVITEIMYHPQLDHLRREFVELHNPCASRLALHGWSLTGVGEATFGPDAGIEAGGFLVVAQDAAAFEAAYGFPPDHVYGGTLANDGETLALVRPDGSTADQVDYEDVAPWPVTPDGFGPSLEVIDPTLANETPRNWRASVAAAGHTAGALNSVNAAGLPPWITDVGHGTPAPDAPISVTGRVEDAEAVWLTYVIDWGEASRVEMLDDGASSDGAAGDGIYGATIPPQPVGTMIRYRIDAEGPAGAMGYPRDDDTVTYQGTYLADPAIASNLPVLHWIMEPAAYSAAIQHFRTDELEPAALFHDGVLYTGLQVRVRGQSSRGWPKKHWKFKFPKGNGFFSEAITPEAVAEFNLQSSYGDKSYLREILAFETFRDAGAPSHLSAPVAVYQNGAFYGLYIWIEEKSSQQLDRNGVDGDGALYKGYSQCEYRPVAQLPGQFEKKNPEDGDFTELHDLLQGINTLEGQARRDFLFDHLDIPAMITYQAASVLVHNNDQVAKNYFLYQDIRRTRRWTFHVWDLDLTFGRSFQGAVLNDRIFAADDDVGRENVSPSHPLFGDRQHQKWDFLWNRLTDAFLSEPEIRAMYYRRLRTLTDELFAPGRYEARIDELTPLIAPDAAADKAKWGQYGVAETLERATTRLIEEYLAVRRTHLLVTHRVEGGLPEAQSPTPAIIINELMYNPPDDGGGVEFVELYNPSPDEAVDLSRWRLQGVDLTIPPGTVLLPGAYLVVVRDDVAFRGTYGSGHFVAAQYPGRLAGGGERIALLDRVGRIVDEVTYDDTDPWPVAADGGGASLELIDPASDNANAAAWAASLVRGGTPGAPNSVGAP